MNDYEKITLSDLKNKYKLGLCIPEIQRDYVMGAGGKSSDGKDKLDKLLDAIRKKYESNEDFDFSCIITYCKDSENAKLEIYDGQQRLTTLMLMILYKLRSEKKDVTEFDNWYSFMGRPKAKEIFNLLTKKELQIDEVMDFEVTDFTSFSMKNLLEKISEYEVTSEYLLNHVKFDIVSIGSQNEIEQFFMDLNSGVKLKDYELYKAKLAHKVNQLKKKNANEAFEMWSHRIDNDWLNFFDVFADYEHPAEEYEIAFVKYCINMIFVEEGRKELINNQIESITDADVIRVYDIMQMITELDLSFFRYKDQKELLNWMLYFSWGESDSDNNKKYNYNIRGAFWNLAFKEYDRMLYYIIKFVLLDTKKSIEMKDDVLLWCFITTLDWQIDIQNEYLRLIKIILNHNVVENHYAWYECQNKGQYLYYCKYTVYAIPQYYGEHLNLKINNDDIKNRHSNMLSLNKSVIQNVKISNTLNRGEIVYNLMKEIENISKVNEGIKNIIRLRIQLLLIKEGNYNNYNDDYVKKENDVFGIVNKITQAIEEKYYAGEVTLCWPTRGKDSSLDCLVRLKCKTDFLFAEFNQNNHNIVKTTMRKSFSIGKEIINGKEMIDKCFWTSSNTVKKLVDRVTWTSITYNKKDSDSAWYNEWRLN